MNSLVQHRIKKFIKKYEARSFDQDDVMLLLIDIRDASKTNSLSRELGDYFAHPHERDRGLTWKILDDEYKVTQESFDDVICGKNNIQPKILCDEIEIIKSVGDSLKLSGIASDVFGKTIYEKSTRDFMLCLVGLLSSFSLKVGGLVHPLKLCLSNRGPFLSIMASIKVVKEDKTISINWNILNTSCRVQEECLKELFPWGNLSYFVARRMDDGELAMCRLETDEKTT